MEAIDNAKEYVEIAIFRFDRTEIEAALMRAAERGVFVHALIAYTNRGGEKNLRQLEMRLLAKGITVGRTADDLIRYHAKYIIIDRRELHLLAFNFTSLDMEQSRSFGIVTDHENFVKEAIRLFEADAKRQPFEPQFNCFVVSPINARKELSAFISGAQEELLIYDPKVGDPAMIRLLKDRAKAGVAVRVIGKMNRKYELDARELRPMRLHTRSIVRDRQWVFTGSQSLRVNELESRREVGIIFEDPEIAKTLVEVFEADWKISGETQAVEGIAEQTPEARVAKKLAKAITKRLPDVEPVIEMVKEAIGSEAALEVDPTELQESIKKAVKQVVQDAVTRDTP